MSIYKGLDVSGQVVLVTGGTSGIGRAIALGLAQSGAKVMAGSTNPEKVGAIKKELRDGEALRSARPRRQRRGRDQEAAVDGNAGGRVRADHPHQPDGELHRRPAG